MRATFWLAALATFALQILSGRTESVPSCIYHRYMFMRKLAISDLSPLMHKMCLEKPATMFYSMFLYYFFILIEFSIGILHEWRIFICLYHGALLTC